MITTTLGALANAEDALGRLSDLKLPIKPAYHLSRLCDLVGQQLRHFHKMRSEWAKEFGEPVEGKPEMVTVKPEHVAEFNAKMQELCAIEVSIDWKPIDLDALGNIDVTAADLGRLECVIAKPTTQE